METVVLSNISVLFICFVLLSILRFVRESDLSKGKQRVICGIIIAVVVCLIVSQLFLDAIAFGIIGPVPN